MTDHQMHIKSVHSFSFLTSLRGIRTALRQVRTQNTNQPAVTTLREHNLNNAFFLKDLFINIKNIWFDSINVFFSSHL